jgi:hypothetical protein
MRSLRRAAAISSPCARWRALAAPDFAARWIGSPPASHWSAQLPKLAKEYDCKDTAQRVRDRSRAVRDHRGGLENVKAEAGITTSHGRIPDEGLLEAVPGGGQTLKVLTLAERGCITTVERGVPRFYPAFRVDAIDTVGAGDCFCGALAVALASNQDAGGDLAHAMRFASAAAAIAVTRHGAIPSMPALAEVQRFLRHHT